jgi:predicted nucleic acid-binding protein
VRLCDINVLVYAHRSDSTEEHFRYVEWLINLATGPEAFGLSEAVLSGFVRVVTNRRIFPDPTPISGVRSFPAFKTDSIQSEYRIGC